MPIDGITVTAVTHELSRVCADAKVEKVVQPEKDEVVLWLHCPNGGEMGKNLRLLLSANPSRPKIHFSSASRENPLVAPNFCMLLRKHLMGSKIISVTQPPFERSVEITFEARTELYETVRRKLILEIMGRSSNLIFTDGEGKIYDLLRPVDITTSSKRIMVPGALYSPPPAQEKTVLSDDSIASLDLDTEKQLSQHLLDTYKGFAPLICREIAFRSSGSVDVRCDDLTNAQKDNVKELLHRILSSVSSGEFKPQILWRESPFDVYCFDILQYGSAVRSEKFDSISSALDGFFAEKDKAEHLKRSSDDILKLLTNIHSRVSRKIVARTKDIEESKKADKYRVYGDLIYANMGLIQPGVRTARVIDYCSEDMREVEIPLDPALSPQRNAQRYYKLYKKAQTTREILSKELPAAKDELRYIESVFESLVFAQTASDFAQIREELRSQGYIKSQPKGASRKLPAAKPLEYRSSEGAKILVGKNNLQNDQLTLRTAAKNDYWFHVKNYPACHTVLFSSETEVTDVSLEEAAIIAASHCKAAKAGQKIEVDYTLIRNVKKPQGAKPGMVIYDNYKTAYVAPDGELCRRLEKK